MKTSLPESLAATVKSTVADGQSGGKVKRLWDRDASLWTGEDEPKWLGWLDIVKEQAAEPDAHQMFATDVQARGFEQILLLGWASTPLELSKRRKLEEISRFWLSDDGHCGFI